MTHRKVYTPEFKQQAVQVARLTPDQETIKRLERENETLRQERSNLKAAAVWFAKEAK